MGTTESSTVTGNVRYTDSGAAPEEETLLNNKTSSDTNLSFNVGFRVLGVQEESPASKVGFVSFFDFIIEANGIRLVRPQEMTHNLYKLMFPESHVGH